MNGAAPPGLVEQLQIARRHLERMRVDLAAQIYRGVLRTSPDCVEALNFFAKAHLNRGEVIAGLTLFKRVAQLETQNPEAWLNLGIAHQIAGNLSNAAQALQASLDHGAGPTAQLYMGLVIEQLGDRHVALSNYFRAVATAQAQGQWNSEQTTPPAIFGLLRHAMNFIHHFRRRAFEEILEPLRAQFGISALGRVEHFLSVYLEELPFEYADPRQRPNLHYFPGLPATPYLDSRLSPFIERLEGQTGALSAELENLLFSDANFQPFLRLSPNASLADFLEGSETTPPGWDAYFFYRHGLRYEQSHESCPKTSALLAELPLVRIHKHAPEILFSVLAPGTRIMPHRGVTNTRVVVHLPLIVPDDCALLVGGEKHVWQPGRCVIFDDTYEHEAWNYSAKPRAILIMDSWNPYLSEVERTALSHIVPSIRDYRRATESLAQ